MRFITLFFALSFSLYSFSQTTLVSWDFADSNPTADGGIPANLSRTITNNATGVTSYPTGSSGTCSSPYTLNSGWLNGSGTKYWQISFATTDYSGVGISFSTRSSGTGPRDFKLQYSITSPTSGFIDVPSSDYAVSLTTCQDFAFAIPAAVDNLADVYLRFIMTSNTSQGGGTVAAGGTNGMDNIIVTAATSMPVSLISFRGLKNKNIIDLSFSTATEINNDYFAIERSNNGSDFTEIGQVKGAGSTRIPQQYTFTDHQPLPGKNYYRLRQVDFDGRSAYSAVVSVVFSKTGDLTLAPSPATDLVLIHLDQPAVEDGVWQVFDVAGRLVQSGNWLSETEETSINVGLLPEGMYTFRLAMGQTVIVKQFKKQ